MKHLTILGLSWIVAMSMIYVACFRGVSSPEPDRGAYIHTFTEDPTQQTDSFASVEVKIVPEDSICLPASVGKFILSIEEVK